MSDLKSALKDAGLAPRKTLHLPRASAPEATASAPEAKIEQTPPAPAPKPAAKDDASPPPKPQEMSTPRPLDRAEAFFHRALVDRVDIELTFTDGSTMIATPLSIGTYAFEVVIDDEIVVIFKVGLRSIRRAPRCET